MILRWKDEGQPDWTIHYGPVAAGIETTAREAAPPLSEYVRDVLGDLVAESPDMKWSL